MNFETLHNTIRTRFQSQVIANLAGIAPQLLNKTTVSVSSGDDSFNDTTEDLSIFIGNQIIMTGFTESANNGLFTIETVTTDKLSVTASLTTESAGDMVSIKTAIAVQYDNDSAFKKPDNTKWIRFSIRPGESFQAYLGNSRWRTPGIFIAQIFVPLGSGDKEAHEIADVITTSFRGINASNIKYKTPYESFVGRDDAFYQVNVTCDFFNDDT